MITKIKNKAKEWLLWSQKYTGMDMAYMTSNSFWTSFNFVVTSLFALVLVYFIGNYLPKETYGIYKYIMSLVGALGFLTLSGMGTAITQAVAKGHKGALTYAVKIQLKWSILFFGGSIILGTYYLLNHNSLIGLSVIMLGIAFPIIDSFNAFGPFLSGKKEFKRLAIWGIWTNAIYVSLMIAAIILQKGAITLVIAYAASNLISTIFLYRKTIKIYKPIDETLSDNKELFKYGFHLSLINILGTLSQYIDKIVIFHYLGAVQLAIYGLALTIPEKIRGYTRGLNSIVLPKLAEKDIENIRPVFYKRIFQSMTLGGLISCGYILISPIAFKIFLPQYIDSIKYSQVISLYFIANLPIAYIGSVFRSQKMLTTIYISSTSFNILRIVLFITLGTLWGIWGVIYGSLITYALGIPYYMILWELELKKFRKQHSAF